MDIKENWLANFRKVVAAEIEAAGGREAAGYRAMAMKVEIGPDYIYQIYKNKPAKSPKRPSFDVMKKINRVYAEGRAGDWVNEPVGSDAHPRPVDGPSLGLASPTTVLALLLDQVSQVNAETRNTLATLIAQAVRDPANAGGTMAAMDALLKFSTGRVETASIFPPVLQSSKK